jgi:predicted HAD superfamily hydrolase
MQVTGAAQQQDCNSFDVFDTLIARTVREPEDVFSIVEQTFPYPGFRQLRTTAQRQLGLCNFNQIYENLQRIAGISQELAMQLQTAELMAEHRVSIPIRAVLDLVQDGDVLISDMYLSGDTIFWLLKKHGFNKKVIIYVTAQGKRTGESYRYVLAHRKIQKHYGDNHHSDIVMAERFGITPVHVTVSAPNATEKLLLDAGLEAASNLLRTFRLASPFLESPTLWQEQARDNIPFLFYMARQLKQIMDAEKRSALYFITRDGCLLHQVFSLLYPSVETHTLYSSRVVHRNPSPDYKVYLKSIYKGRDASLLFDIHGGFASGRELYHELFGHYPRVHVCFPIQDPVPYDGLTFELARVTAAWELYNCDVIGTLVNYCTQFGPVYAPNEFDVVRCKKVHSSFA